MEDARKSSARRRSDPVLGPQEVLEAVLYSPLEWHSKTICLERNALVDFVQRPARAQVSIAELYHENTKLFPAQVPQLAALGAEYERIRVEIARRLRRVCESRRPSDPQLRSPIRSLLDVLSRETAPELAYALELHVATRNVVGQCCAGASVATTAPLSTTSERRLHEALDLGGRVHDGNAPPLLFIVGCFARNDLLLGARGYRRTLLEAGRFTQSIVVAAGRLGLEPEPVYEFADRELDEILELDGVERGVLAVVRLWSVADEA